MKQFLKLNLFFQILAQILFFYAEIETLVLLQ